MSVFTNRQVGKIRLAPARACHRPQRGASVVVVFRDGLLSGFNIMMWVSGNAVPEISRHIVSRERHTIQRLTGGQRSGLVRAVIDCATRQLSEQQLVQHNVDRARQLGVCLNRGRLCAAKQTNQKQQGEHGAEQVLNRFNHGRTPPVAASTPKR